MSIQSISALKECMADLGIRASEQIEVVVEAKFFNHRSLAHGNIDTVVHTNPYSGDGPYLSFDDSIRGFGIHYSEFRPRWVDIVYDKKARSLRLSHTSYDFSLTFGETA